MKLPADVHATFTACVQKFPHDGDDEQRRGAMEKAVQTIRARHSLRYVWKTEHSNLSSPSKDGMGYVPDGAVVHGQRTRMFIWDMMNGTTRQPNPAGESEPIREAYVLAPEPKDWLTGDTPPPPPPDDLEELKLSIMALQSRLNMQAGEIVAMKTDVNAARGQAIAASGAVATLRGDFENYVAHPPPAKLPELVAKGQTSRSFGHSHTVELPVVPKP